MQHPNRLLVVLLVIAALQLSACAQAPATREKIVPAQVEPIEGSDLKRVVLTVKAAERLGIQTALVREEQVVRQREVGGKVVASPQAGASTILVRVAMSESDLASVDRSQPAVVLPLDDGEDDDEEAEGLEAEAVDDVEDDDADEAAMYFSINNAGQQALAPGQPVRVKLAIMASGASRKIIPYAALIYDVKGGTWVYTKEKPGALAFLRHSISVDYIEGNLAFLTEGPPAGTEVVTVGGALLYGTETGVSK